MGSSALVVVGAVTADVEQERLNTSWRAALPEAGPVIAETATLSRRTLELIQLPDSIAQSG